MVRLGQINIASLSLLLNYSTSLKTINISVHHFSKTLTDKSLPNHNINMFLRKTLASAPTRTFTVVAPVSWSYTRSLASTAYKMSAISDTIKEDHREIEKYYKNILNAANDDEATRWQNQFTWELARHSIAEELVVYPAFEKYLGIEGHDKAEKDRAQHQEVISLRINTILSILLNYTRRLKKNSRLFKTSRLALQNSYLHLTL